MGQRSRFQNRKNRHSLFSGDDYNFCLFLQGQPEVLRLLDPQSPWVKDGAPPKYIRALLYKYHFTSWGKH